MAVGVTSGTWGAGSTHFRSGLRANLTWKRKKGTRQMRWTCHPNSYWGLGEGERLEGEWGEGKRRKGFGSGCGKEGRGKRSREVFGRRSFLGGELAE